VEVALLSVSGKDLSFFRTVTEDAKAFGRSRVSVSLGLLALLGLNGYSVVFLYRLEAALSKKCFPFSALAKVVSRLNCICNSCQISPHADIGPGLHIPHPVGIVCGAITAGRNLTLKQNATLGVRDSALPYQDRRNFPSLGDNVTVGPNAACLGSITIGDGATIGANAVVLNDVPPGCRAVGNPARMLPPRV
jgi:serine O-acetyltransferase